MAHSREARPSSLAAHVDHLQSTGRYCFTRSELEGRLRLSGPALEAALRRLRARGRIVSPRRGFHVIVPLEHREAGAPPPSWFLDDLMRVLGQPYYVGLLSAAALHGAAHQQPMVFQVITDRPTRPARAGRARIAFHAVRNLADVPVLRVATETGTLCVSTPEATAFDLVRFAPAAGHLGNVATVLRELAEKLDPATLAEVASAYAVADVQRLGWLLEQIGERERAAGLVDWLEGRRVRPVLLARGERRGGAQPGPRWRVIANETLEVDG